MNQQTKFCLNHNGDLVPKHTLKMPELARGSDMGKILAKTHPERYRIYEALKAAPDPSGSSYIVNQTGNKPNAIRRLLSKMFRDGQIIRVARGKYSIADQG